MKETLTPYQSLLTFSNSQGEKARGTLIKLTRNTVIMEVYNPYSIVQLSEVLQDLTIRRGEHIIYQGRAVVSNLMSTGLMLVVSVTLVDPWQILSGILDKPKDIRIEVNQFLNNHTPTKQLSPKLLLAVIEMRALLSDLSRWLEQVDLTDDSSDQKVASLQKRSLTYELSEPLLPIVSDLYEHFEEAVSKISVDEVTNHKIFVQQNLHPLLMRSPFLYRTLRKPLGYAGDYEMMNMLQRDGAEGPTVYTMIINLFLTQIPISRSVCNRTATLHQILVQEANRVAAQGRPFRAMSIACGPAIEVARFIRSGSVPEECHFTLIDFEPTALTYAKGKIEEACRESGRHVSVEYRLKEVDFLLKKSASSELASFGEDYELVYCSGLFDYFSDRVCSRLLKVFFNQVRPEGMVYVTNMHPSNPHRGMMEYMMEWYLIYRNEAQMAELAPTLGKQRFTTDSTGVNLGLEIRKPR